MGVAVASTIGVTHPLLNDQECEYSSQYPQPHPHLSRVIVAMVVAVIVTVIVAMVVAMVVTVVAVIWMRKGSMRPPVYGNRKMKEARLTLTYDGDELSEVTGGGRHRQGDHPKQS